MNCPDKRPDELLSKLMPIVPDGCLQNTYQLRSVTIEYCRACKARASRSGTSSYSCACIVRVFLKASRGLFRFSSCCNPGQHVKALVLAGGGLHVSKRVLARLEGIDLVVAADGGARHATSLGLSIDLWVGDFDSSQGLEKTFIDVPRQTHSADKNQVDTELALEAARSRGATEALVIGAFGGRFDHALTIATLALNSTLARFPVDLESGSEAGWSLVPGRDLALNFEPGVTFSVIALSPIAAGLSVTGAKWPLKRADLPFGLGWGVSNVALGLVRFSLEAGLALIVAQFPEA
jgi:thiamine pyrophosphokinase